MKKQVVNNENKSIISSLFTEAELAELNFSAEEIEAIENAEMISRAADVMPNSEKEMDAFFNKFDATFPPSADIEGTYQKFVDLAKSDPVFFNQIVAMHGLVDVVEEVPPAETSKVSLDEIKMEQSLQLDEEKKAKLARLDAVLEKLAKEEK